jgi:predicted NAD/FAD-binding protein
MTGRRIAVVGGGVSGITAGYVLAQADHVTLFEADDRLGGHADTHPTGVDTGFIVYNERTYPLLTRLFAELGVATQPSQMSMSVRCAACGLQYAGQRGLPGLAAGLPRGRGRYVRMLAEVPRFHRAARRLLDHGDPVGQTLADFLRTGGFSRYFTAHFALPLVAAVWSCPSGTALRYPARYLFAFLANHGMLSVSGSPPWRTVTGGSRRYVERAAKRLDEIRLSTPVRAVRLLDRPPTPNATCSAPSPTPRTAPCCTPTPPCCPAARPSARRGTTSSAGASRTARRRASATT